MTQLSIIGAGSWGCALAQVLSGHYHRIHLWYYKQAKNRAIPPAITDNPNIKINTQLDDIAQSEAVLIVVPSNAFLATLKNIKPHLKKQQIAWASKGFESGLVQLLHQCFSQVLPQFYPTLISGPSFATEVMQKKPTALVVSSEHKISQDYWITALQSSPFIRVYKNSDLIGAQVGGAVKNILAIAAGIVAGLDYGTNTQAALITRGLAEITRLGIALGGVRETFMGLTGLGDLVLTCSDNLSRNRQFGYALAKLGDIQQAKQAVNSTTIEGLNALTISLKLAQKAQVEMPICEQIYQVIYKQKSPKDAIATLMQREITSE